MEWHLTSWWKGGLRSEVVFTRTEQPWKTQDRTEATTDRTPFDDVMKVVSEGWGQGRAPLVALLLNEVMKLEPLP
jgi:hypothetical protein